MILKKHLYLSTVEQIRHWPAKKIFLMSGVGLRTLLMHFCKDFQGKLPLECFFARCDGGTTWPTVAACRFWMMARTCSEPYKPSLNPTSYRKLQILPGLRPNVQHHFIPKVHINVVSVLLYSMTADWKGKLKPKGEKDWRLLLLGSKPANSVFSMHFPPSPYEIGGQRAWVFPQRMAQAKLHVMTFGCKDFSNMSS